MNVLPPERELIWDEDLFFLLFLVFTPDFKGNFKCAPQIFFYLPQSRYLGARPGTEPGAPRSDGETFLVFTGVWLEVVAKISKVPWAPRNVIRPWQ